jgi:hypothetical protein
MLCGVGLGPGGNAHISIRISERGILRFSNPISV